MDRINTGKNSKCWLGKVRRIVGSSLLIYDLTPRAKWGNGMPPYKLGNIRTIEFDTEYINSLMLMANAKKR